MSGFHPAPVERTDSSKSGEGACYPAPVLLCTCRRPPQAQPGFLVTRIDPRILADLKRENLLKEGHWSFQYGGHSRGLIDRDHLLSDPVAASHMAYALAKQFFTQHIETWPRPRSGAPGWPCW